MKRRLLSLLTSLSLLLCVAACLAWLRSYGTRTASEFVRRGVRWEAVSERGWLSLSNEPQLQEEARQWCAEYDRLLHDLTRQIGEHGAAMREAGRAGFGADDQRLSTAKRLLAHTRQRNAAVAAHGCSPRTRTLKVQYLVPHALPVAVAAGMPAMWLARWRRQRRRRLQGRCPACVYDLRATPARCPECGHRPAAAATAVARAS
jgi:hypothetical protein